MTLDTFIEKCNQLKQMPDICEYETLVPLLSELDISFRKDSSTLNLIAEKYLIIAEHHDAEAAVYRAIRTLYEGLSFELGLNTGRYNDLSNQIALYHMSEDKRYLDSATKLLNTLKTKFSPNK